MNKLLYFFTLAFSIFYCSCANIIPPGGGPRDSLPPKLVAVLPKDSSLQFKTKKITFTFNEFVEITNAQENVILNPLPNKSPSIDYKLKNVTTILNDTLEPNTTYTINFGSAIKDVNEGNILKNFTYTFSTGKNIDKGIIKGKIKEAATENIDTTLVVVLHKNLSDTAVIKLKPNYLSRVNGSGEFLFTNLPSERFNIFVITNNFLKKYDDSTLNFAFADAPVKSNQDINEINLSYFKFPIQEKKTIITPKNDKKLKLTSNIDGGRFNILDSTIKLNFEKKLIVNNKQLIKILDSNFKTLTVQDFFIDTTIGTITFKNNLAFGTKYHIIIDKLALTDSYNNSLNKTDTLTFTTFATQEYGSIKIRCTHFDLEKNPVIQIIKDNVIVASKAVTEKNINFDTFNPGEYSLRVLFDKNKNGIWDTGNYKTKLQPEQVIAIKNKLSVKANWDNEVEIVL